MVFNHVAMTFLGRHREGAYETAEYEFDGTRSQPTSLFGIALCRHLRSLGRQPLTLAVLGTRGSQWDDLASKFLDEDDALVVALKEKAEADNVCQADVDELARKISPRLSMQFQRQGPSRLVLRVTGYARDGEGQLKMIEEAASLVGADDAVYFDITHSLRHLPLLMLGAAQIVQRLRNAPLKEIYYAAFEMVPRAAPKPVLRLTGLGPISDWLAAFHTYDRDGDYSVFATLMEGEGVAPEACDLLREAAFREQAGQFQSAAEALEKAKAELERWEGRGTTGLFLPELMSRIGWTGQRTLYVRQRRFAFDALKRGDAMRAAIWGHEAAQTRICEHVCPGKRPSDAKTLRQIEEKFWTSKGATRAQKLAFDDLKRWRRCFAHADRTKLRMEQKRLLDSREDCLNAIEECLEKLLPASVARPVFR